MLIGVKIRAHISSRSLDIVSLSYITFITPSAYRELAEWMKYREESGEIINDDSWLCVICGIHK